MSKPKKSANRAEQGDAMTTPLTPPRPITVSEGELKAATKIGEQIRGDHGRTDATCNICQHNANIIARHTRAPDGCGHLLTAHEWSVAYDTHHRYWIGRVDQANAALAACQQQLAEARRERDQLAAALETAKQLVEIVEGTRNQRWSSNTGGRLKDTPEWCAFYVAVARAASLDPQPGKERNK